MGGQKAKPIRTPFEQKNTYAPQSVSNTPEAQAFLDVPIDVDPGVGQRTDLARQQVENRWNSSFNAGLPGFVRDLAQQKELRDVNARGAQEAQQAEYGRKQLELGRRQMLLPQILQTGQSGYGTQITQPTPGFLSSLGGGLGGIFGAFRKPS